MRRSEREITDKEMIDDILHRAGVLYLSMVDGDQPYVIPLNFGYDGTAIYLHSAREGRKIDLLTRNPRVCFCVSVDDAVIPGEMGCRWSARYRSVIGSGTVHFLETREERVPALDAILTKFAEGPFQYDDEVLARTAVWRIDITALSGKQAGY